MIRHLSGRLFVLAGVLSLALVSQPVQASLSTAAVMTITGAIAHGDTPVNALVYVHADDSVVISVVGADIHPEVVYKPSPGLRIFNLRHLPPHQVRVAEVIATFTYHTKSGATQLVTLSKHVKVMPGTIEHVHLSLPEFDQARPSPRIACQPIVLYEFCECGGRMVFDNAKHSAKPLDLYIHDAGKTRWSKNRGLQIKGSVLIKSVRPAKELVRKLKKSNAITIEAWIEPENQTQQGPARIVSLSHGTSERNFTLGQEKDRYDVRLRATHLADKNNGQPSVSTRPHTVHKHHRTHVVYTRLASGEARIYIDGKLTDGGKVPGKLSGWNDHFHLLLGNETSLNRKWLGWFYLVAIYDCALTQDDVTQNFRAGL